MKMKILCMVAIIICLSIITGSTLAYFTAEDTTRNEITAGGVRVNVIEQRLVDGALQAYPSQPVQIMPGTTVSKIVSVQSTEQPAWVRVGYTLAIYDMKGTLMEIPSAELARLITIEPDRSNWTMKDGWWYYNAAVKTGETTKPLFDAVSFSGPDMGNEYQSCTVEIIVTAQATQVANNGTSAMDALGWPEA